MSVAGACWYFRVSDVISLCRVADIEGIKQQVMPWSDLEARMQNIADLGDNEVRKRLDTVSCSCILEYVYDVRMKSVKNL